MELIISYFIIGHRYRFKRLRTPANVLIGNLAVCDLLSCCLHSMAIYSTFRGRWSFGQTGRRHISISNSLIICVSLWRPRCGVSSGWHYTIIVDLVVVAKVAIWHICKAIMEHLWSHWLSVWALKFGALGNKNALLLPFRQFNYLICIYRRYIYSLSSYRRMERTKKNILLISSCFSFVSFSMCLAIIATIENHEPCIVI